MLKFIEMHILKKIITDKLSCAHCVHSVYIAPLCELLPLRIELACRCVRFICKCLCSENYVISAVPRNGVYSSRAVFCR